MTTYVALDRELVAPFARIQVPLLNQKDLKS